MRADVIRDDETDDINVRYFYEYKEFTAKIDGFTVYGDKAVIYVKRKEPQVVKEFIPVSPMSAPVYISCFFMAGIILLFDTVEHQVLSVALKVAQGGLFHDCRDLWVRLAYHS